MMSPMDPRLEVNRAPPASLGKSSGPAISPQRPIKPLFLLKFTKASKMEKGAGVSSPGDRTATSRSVLV